MFLLPRKLVAITRMLSSRHYRTVVVEGNIASGKSVLLEHFRKFPNFKIFPEPVEKWQNFNSYNMLNLLYRDSKRWSFAFQMYADLTRLSVHQSEEKLQPGDIKLMERSLYSGKYCFAENSYHSGSLCAEEYAVLNSYFDWFTGNLSEMVKVDLIVYLRTKPETCQHRLLERCRTEEMAIPLEYLTSLHELYEKWLIEKKQPVPAEVTVIDANADLPSLYKAYDQLASKLSSGWNVENEQNRPSATHG